MLLPSVCVLVPKKRIQLVCKCKQVVFFKNISLIFNGFKYVYKWILPCTSYISLPNHSLLFCAPIHVFKLCRCTTFLKLKHPYKRRYGHKSTAKSYISYRITRLNQKLLSPGDSLLIDIFIEAYTRKLLEQTLKVKFAEAAFICHLIQL